MATLTIHRRFPGAMMRTLSVSLAFIVVAFATPGAGAQEANVYKRFDVKGIQLGMPLASLKGFKCFDPLESIARCVKFVDERCNAGKCTIESGSSWIQPRLNGTKADLDLIMVKVSDTPSHLVYEIESRFSPRQLLDKNSTLGRALITKYGEPAAGSASPDPKDPVGGGRMAWVSTTTPNEGVQLTADCQRPENHNDHKEKQCVINVYEPATDTLVRARKEGSDAKMQKLRGNQPSSAPQL